MRGGQMLYAVVGGEIVEGRLTHVCEDYRGKCDRPGQK